MIHKNILKGQRTEGLLQNHRDSGHIMQTQGPGMLRHTHAQPFTQTPAPPPCTKADLGLAS